MELALRIVLAVVLLWAAAAKLRDMPRFAAAVAEHGVPARLRRPVAWAVVAIEAALGVLVLIGPTARAAAARGLGAGAGLRRARWRGCACGARGARRCGCFGRRPRAPGRAAGRPRARAWRRSAGWSPPARRRRAAPSSGDASSRPRWRRSRVVVAILVVLVLALYRQVGVLEARLGPRPRRSSSPTRARRSAPPPRRWPASRAAAPSWWPSARPGCRLCAEIAAGAAARWSATACACTPWPRTSSRTSSAATGCPARPTSPTWRTASSRPRGSSTRWSRSRSSIATGRERARAAA